MTRARTLARSAPLLALPLLLALPAPPAHADLACGDVVTSSTTLTADLQCAPGQDGIVVSGHGIVIDLAGHTLDGGTDQLHSAGVRLTPGSSGVVVQHGTIAHFGVGVVLDTATDNRVWDLVLHANVRGVDVANASRNVIDKNTISGSGLDAVRLDGAADDNRVAQNSLSGNVFGVGVAGGARTLVTQNVISTTRGFGVAVFSDAAAATVSRNTVTGGSWYGIEVTTEGAGTTVSQNDVSGNARDGIYAGVSGVHVARNLATYNGQSGIDAVGAVDGGGNVAYGNAAQQCIGVVCDTES